MYQFPHGNTYTYILWKTKSFRSFQCVHSKLWNAEQHAAIVKHLLEADTGARHSSTDRDWQTRLPGQQKYVLAVKCVVVKP